LNRINNLLKRFRSPFHGLTANSALLADGRDLRLPHLTYLIVFVLRSSSTRLTHLLRAPGQYGDPEEWFSTEILRAHAPVFGAACTRDYIDQLCRRCNQAGVFAAEVPWLKMRRLCRETTFLATLKPQKLIWLIRQDIVAQAVSAVRMVQTGISQSILVDRQTRTEGKDRHHYDDAAIRHRLRM
jgi:LPS sulfotransferase NodH